MKDLQTILSEYEKIDFTVRKAAMATVVKVWGSSYRSPGARMLITDDGKWVGSISGGCLEGDALRKARQVMSSNIPATVTYDTREESNQKLGIGLGCNGIIDVFIEPVQPQCKHGVINLFKTIVTSNQPHVLATITNSSSSKILGERLLIDAHLKTLVKFSNEAINEALEKDALDILAKKKSESKSYYVEGTEIKVFIELIQPCISLILFGGGFDARPVSQLAKSLGWNVLVTDECVAHIAPVFFPSADKLSLCNRSFIDRDFNITEFTACVLMSHNYEYDRDVLKKLITTPSPYIGILGPRKRFDKMLEEFRKMEIKLTSKDIERIHSPIGLDIGAETPDEIAVAIVGEIQGKFSNRSGGFLKYRQGPIHERNASDGAISKQIYLHPEEDSEKASRPA
jgi:xanthine dehydrogenase accessory factor